MPRNFVRKLSNLLPVPLTEGEKREHGRALAKLELDLRNVANERKSANDAFKNRSSRLEADRARYADELSSGKTHREVPCEAIYDFENNAYYEVRLDTREEVPASRRPLEESERQAAIEMPEENVLVPGLEVDRDIPARCENEHCGNLAETGETLCSNCERHRSTLAEGEALARELGAHATDEKT